MVDFSANRRGQNAETKGYETKQDLASEYRPFSTIISNQGDEEVVRPSLYGATNQPMSLELEHKRSAPLASKSVQKPKKGILKNSSNSGKAMMASSKKSLTL